MASWAGTVRQSPTFRMAEGFMDFPCLLILPPSHALEARPRVLKNRVAQSHLSTRRVFGDNVCGEGMEIKSFVL